MTGIEELLRQDVEAVTSQIVTTEQDLRDARARLEQRLVVRQQRDRRRATALAAAAASVVVGVTGWQVLKGDDKEESPVGPITESTDSDAAFLAGVPPTTDQLLGVWRAHNRSASTFLWMFTADGTVRLDAFGSLADDPAVLGTFEVTDDAILVEMDAGWGLDSCEDTSWTLRAVVNQDGGLNVVPADVDRQNLCGQVWRSRWVLDRVLPMPEGGEVVEGPPSDGGNPPAARQELVGSWSDPSGSIVELSRDGRYTRLTGQAEVGDRGTWTLADGRTRLTLVSAAGSPTCSEGDQFVVGGLRARPQDGSLLLGGSIERNDCTIPWAGTGWYRLAP